MAAEDVSIDKETINLYFQQKKADIEFLDACRKGDAIVVDILINLGIDVNKVYDNKYTPLIEACRENHDEIVDLLIEAGADVNQMILNPHYFLIPLYSAISNRNYYIVKKLLKAGVKVDYHDDNINQSPLHFAATFNFSKVFELLIKYGCTVNCKDYSENADTPLHDAAKSGSRRAIRKLVSLGADINAKNETYGYTPLHEAVESGGLETVKLLVELGAEIESLDGNEFTPLLLAISEKKMKIVKFLISKGANPTLTTIAGHTTFDLIAEDGDYDSDDPDKIKEKNITTFLLSEIWDIKKEEEASKRQRTE